MTTLSLSRTVTRAIVIDDPVQSFNDVQLT